MPELVAYLLLFVAVGVAFLLAPLVIGRLLRPSRPNPEKDAIYECGEPTIGSSWIQFDLRFYVVALLFVIFDVEMAFFFPWAVVFGTANKMADPDLPAEQRAALSQELAPRPPNAPPPPPSDPAKDAAAAKRFAWFVFFDILVFFGVLLVGFAYLWKRGDLDWVRSTAAQLNTVQPQMNADERR